jgi:hypothetical protein
VSHKLIPLSKNTQAAISVGNYIKSESPKNGIIITSTSCEPRALLQEFVRVSNVVASNNTPRPSPCK